MKMYQQTGKSMFAEKSYHDLPKTFVITLFVIYVTVFDNLRNISGNVREQRNAPSMRVTTAVKDIHIRI